MKIIFRNLEDDNLKKNRKKHSVSLCSFSALYKNKFNSVGFFKRLYQMLFKNGLINSFNLKKRHEIEIITLKRNLNHKTCVIYLFKIVVCILLSLSKYFILSNNGIPTSFFQFLGQVKGAKKVTFSEITDSDNLGIDFTVKTSQSNKSLFEELEIIINKIGEYAPFEQERIMKNRRRENNKYYMANKKNIEQVLRIFIENYNIPLDSEIFENKGTDSYLEIFSEMITDQEYKLSFGTIMRFYGLNQSLKKIIIGFLGIENHEIVHPVFFYILIKNLKGLIMNPKVTLIDITKSMNEILKNMKINPFEIENNPKFFSYIKKLQKITEISKYDDKITFYINEDTPFNEIYDYIYDIGTIEYRGQEHNKILNSQNQYVFEENPLFSDLIKTFNKNETRSECYHRVEFNKTNNIIEITPDFVSFISKTFHLPFIKIILHNSKFRYIELNIDTNKLHFEKMIFDFGQLEKRMEEIISERRKLRLPYRFHVEEKSLDTELRIFDYEIEDLEENLNMCKKVFNNIFTFIFKDSINDKIISKCNINHNEQYGIYLKHIYSNFTYPNEALFDILSAHQIDEMFLMDYQLHQENNLEFKPSDFSEFTKDTKSVELSKKITKHNPLSQRRNSSRDFSKSNSSLDKYFNFKHSLMESPFDRQVCFCENIFNEQPFFCPPINYLDDFFSNWKYDKIEWKKVAHNLIETLREIKNRKSEFVSMSSDFILTRLESIFRHFHVLYTYKHAIQMRICNLNLLKKHYDLKKRLENIEKRILEAELQIENARNISVDYIQKCMSTLTKTFIPFKGFCKNGDFDFYHYPQSLELESISIPFRYIKEFLIFVKSNNLKSMIPLSIDNFDFHEHLNLTLGYIRENIFSLYPKEFTDPILCTFMKQPVFFIDSYFDKKNLKMLRKNHLEKTEQDHDERYYHPYLLRSFDLREDQYSRWMIKLLTKNRKVFENVFLKIFYFVHQ